MKRLIVFSALWCFVFSAAPASGMNLAGEWEYQALNSGDTNFKVEQEGSALTFYRVLHPEFEGKRYKLEHIYRGELRDQRIVGKMFVREEGMADFEYLRKFEGKLVSENKLVVDDMPLKRTAQVVVADTQSPPPEPDKPKYAKVVIQREDPREKEPPKATEPPPAPDSVAKPAPFVIPKLIPVERRVTTGKDRRVRKLLDGGDTFYGRKEFGRAVTAYAAALKLDALKVELLYKLGLCHGILGSRAHKAGNSARAAAHLHQAIGFWSRAARYDPYNDGAKENIRRAQKKISRIENCTPRKKLN
ncbi:MAG: hypothetical protein JRF33_14040 [Deltaproteobacteria bacterium]|nr:hypothetical protein [Deltaproteobacteria bacterium]